MSRFTGVYLLSTDLTEDGTGAPALSPDPQRGLAAAAEPAGWRMMFAQTFLDDHPGAARGVSERMSPARRARRN